ncbi:CopG family transcriptional regulator [Corynebacterium sp. HMSC072B09]|uniref:ribbon-helix-helix domain-containing protein n=1 Tax=unclassified Corynebacterium TaxID=2624378 RepID=UPI0008AA4BDE|nr:MULTISPECIES: CopG family transcriptional regulator [unclassified Corynebacterium]OHR27541.1 CopG family transcriptional regulator [Corynebacterium sp. HMSC072B09]OHR28501.1 CopG family transcriptional regulator [Corynebacterium sp. HMSC073B01]
MPVNITEKQLDAWVAEAEHGYDVDELKQRGRGRPGRGPKASQMVTVRLAPEELESLDRTAAEKQLSRSEMMRQAITALTAA